MQRKRHPSWTMGENLLNDKQGMQSYQPLRDAAEPGCQAAYSMSFNCLSAPRIIATLQKMMACLAAPDS